MHMKSDKPFAKLLPLLFLFIGVSLPTQAEIRLPKGMTNYIALEQKETVSGEEICVESEIVCATSPYGRGISTNNGLTCSIACPDNFVPDASGEECVPSCYHDRFPYCFDLIID